MNKILIAINPRWCREILAGRKTIEVRKTRPNCRQPIKCYIYCTLSGSNELFREVLSRDIAKWNKEGWADKKGNVIGECTIRAIDRVCRVGYMGQDDTQSEYMIVGHLAPQQITADMYRAMALSKSEIAKYFGGKEGYLWHISDVQEYAKPIPVSSFIRLRETKFGLELNEIERPPQSWFYVTEGGKINE